ncbi:hypothetical protein [Streptomyces sp. NBC_00576]|uniref:hypothetical protein n=1 Tax=Streptomyces sp. NBC_00576 TaxID=2903665 RepID=UPI002E7FE3FB|nr:hypothetical protein [Streptomyces sp. NBC_00576]WUB71087.1 hypothetical protein OG734_13870 [Streptomyces sp. NBC_00576]
MALEFHHSLFEGGDLPLEVVDVGGRSEAGVAPGLFTELLGEPVLQLPDAAVSRALRSRAFARSACREVLLTWVCPSPDGGAVAAVWMSCSRSRWR